MKTKLITAFLLAGTGVMPGLLAQENATVDPAPAAVSAPTVAPIAVNQTVYTPRLPTAQELTNAAAAQGVTVARIEQSEAQVVVTYQYSNGQTNVVAYLPLPSSVTPSVNPTVVTTAPPTVVYAPAPPRVVYYSSPGYYDPWYWYPPVSLSLGFGFSGHSGYRYGGHYGGYYGGHHGGWRGHR